MKAGAGKAEFSLPPKYLEIEDFVVVHRTLNARALVLEDGAKWILVSLELTSMPDEEAWALQKAIAERFRVDEGHIWICVTHTFSAPHFWSDTVLADSKKIAQKRRFRENLHRATMQALEKAFLTMGQVKVGLGCGYSSVNVNRDIQTEDGWWVGTKGLGLSDHQVYTLRIDKENGEPLAVLFHYAIQSSVLHGSRLSAGGKAVTPDVAGIACAHIEKNMPGAVAIFLIGASGDQAPIEKAVQETFVRGERVRTDRKEEGFGICESLGESLGETVRQTAQRLECIEACKELTFGRREFPVPGQKMEQELAELRPKTVPEYESCGDRTAVVEAIGIGELVFVGVKPELNCASGVTLQTLSPYAHTLVCTMVNGSAKYMAQRDAYERSTYEAMNSIYGKGAAEILIQETLGLLKEMKK